MTTHVQTFDLTSLADLELHNVRAERVMYQADDQLPRRRVLRLVEQLQESADDPDATGHALAIIAGSDFHDGVIETEVAGAPRSDTLPEMRGFVGIAFRVQPHGSRFECFFVRPTNGRADDQLRRNHATQYISHPDYPWYRLREETPGRYEAYADLVPGAWTKIKIAVSGVRAQLYVNGAPQPCLVVNDLKLGHTPGQIALWIGTGTEAYFSKVVVKQA